LSGMVNQDLGEFIDACISHGSLQTYSIFENLSNYITGFWDTQIGNRIILQENVQYKIHAIFSTCGILVGNVLRFVMLQKYQIT